MNKSILQLMVLLLIVAFATLVLLKIAPSNYLADKTTSKTADIHLPVPFTHSANAPKNRHRFIKENPTINLYYLLEMVKADLAKGKYSKAENTLRNLLLFYPHNKTVLSLLGGVLYSSGNYEQARNMFKLMVKNDSNDPLARENLGLVLERQHKYAKAIKEFLRASLLKPNSASMYLNLAGLYSIIGAKKRAVYNFEKVYKIIGVNILPLSFDPAFNNIRNMAAFIDIINKVEIQRLGSVQKDSVRENNELN